MTKELKEELAKLDKQGGWIYCHSFNMLYRSIYTAFIEDLRHLGIEVLEWRQPTKTLEHHFSLSFRGGGLDILLVLDGNSFTTDEKCFGWMFITIVKSICKNVGGRLVIACSEDVDLSKECVGNKGDGIGPF